MSNLAMWSLIVGFLLPPAIAVVQQPRWSEPVRAIVMFVVCLIAAAGTAYFQGDLTGRRWIQAALLIVVATIATFKGLWKPTRVAPEIEAATSRSG